MAVISDPLFYALAIPAVVALGLSKGGFVGVGQIGTPLLALLMPPLEAAAILLPIMLVQDAVSVWAFRKDWSGRILAVMLPGAIVGIGAAWLLAAYISDSMVRIAIGVITVLFLLINWIGARLSAPAPRPPSKVRGTLWGIVSGFTSTLCQAGGPPFQMHVLPQNLAKMTFVGTTGVFFASVNVLKVVPYFALGQFSTAGLGTSLALLPLAIATNFLGFWVVRTTPQALFYKITMALMLVIALELTRSGVTDLLHSSP